VLSENGIDCSLPVPRYEEVEVKKKHKMLLNPDIWKDRVTPEFQGYISGWDDCLDHIRAQGFKIVREVK
jgi:hypothetical protein